METHHHNPDAKKWAEGLYYLTYVTGALSIVFAIITSLHFLQTKSRPSIPHMCLVTSFLATTVCGLPYLWSKPEARYKLFAYLVGWSVSLVLLIVARLN